MRDEQVLSELWDVIDDRFKNPVPGSYVTGLAKHEKGIDRVLEKVGEESTEFILAIKNQVPERTVAEAADLIFHLMVALRAADVSLEAVLSELAVRRR